MPSLGQSMAQGRDDQPPRHARVTEPDLGFRRVDVHIDQRRIAVDEQRRRRVPVAAEEIEIGRPQRTGQHLVAHGSPVDEQVLRHRRAPGIGRQGGVAIEPDPLARGVDLQGVLGKLAPQHTPQTGVQRVEQITVLTVGAEGHATLSAARDIAQSEGHRRFGHRQTLDCVRDRLRLGPVGAHEFQAGWRGVEQIAQLDHCACAQGGGFHRLHLATCDMDLRRIRPADPAGDRQASHGPQRRQRLAPETKGMDVQQVRAVDFRGRMAGQGQRQVLRRDAAAIIGDADQGLAAISDVDGDPRGPCVHRVFHQLLDGRGRALHNLTRSDPVDCCVVKLPDDGPFLADIGVCVRHTARPSTIRRDSTTGLRRIPKGLKRASSGPVGHCPQIARRRSNKAGRSWCEWCVRPIISDVLTQ